MALLRIYGNFQQVDEHGRIDLGGSPEAWSGHRIDGELRAGLHVLVYDGDWEAECVLEFDGGDWFARIFAGTAAGTTKSPTKAADPIAPGTLEEFRDRFWPSLRTPRGRRSRRFYDVWADLELIKDELAGPLYSIYTKGECDYVYSDRTRFPTIHDPESFLAWCLSLVDQYRQGALKAEPSDEAEKSDQAKLLESADAMESISRMAFGIVRERQRQQGVGRGVA